jgi:hypothetical protein
MDAFSFKSKSIGDLDLDRSGRQKYTGGFDCNNMMTGRMAFCGSD